MNSLIFHKYTAAGNDFILFDRKEIGERKFAADEIVKMCDRRFGIGADGILIVSDSENYNFDLKFFNPDGTNGMLCANGSRCAVHYAKKSNYMNGIRAEFSVNGEQYSALAMEEENVTLLLEDFDASVRSVKIEVKGISLNGFFIDTGAPHFIVDASENFPEGIDEIDVKSLGSQISRTDFFQPDKTNVDFIEICDGVVKMRTYERGVEDETLSCGTGAIAAGILAGSVYGIAYPITVVTPGGKAIVDVNSVEGSVSLTGKVELIFEGKYF